MRKHFEIAGVGLAMLLAMGSTQAMADESSWGGAGGWQESGWQGDQWRNPGRPYYNCQTSSKGRTFRESDFDHEVARRRTVEACRRDYYSDYRECDYNLSCSSSVPNPGPGAAVTRCTTRSIGKDFVETDRDPLRARQEVVQACSRAPYTRPEECRMNVRCETLGHGGPGGPGWPYPTTVSCTARSRGFTFTESARERHVAFNEAVDRCVKHPYTVAYECRSDVTCTNSNPIPPRPRLVTCRTNSRGRPFIEQGYDDEWRLKSRVVDQCRADRFTDRYECERNAFCQSDR